MRTLAWRGWLSAVLILFVSAPAALANKLPGKLGVYRFPVDLAQELNLPAPGAAIYWVVPNSAAHKAGIKTGDVITALDSAQIQNFDDLADRVGKLGAGDKVAIQYVRDSQPQTAELTLSAWAGDLGSESYQMALEYLRKRLAERQGPALVRSVVAQQWNLGERLKAVDELKAAIAQSPQELTYQEQLLEWLQKLGRYDDYVEQALGLAEKNPRSATLQLDRIDALMATGQNADAEKRAANLATTSTRWPATITETTAEAVQRWGVARLRLGKPLTDPALGRVLNAGPWKHPSLDAMDYWRQELKNQKPYELTSGRQTSELEFHASGVLFGLVPHKMRGITIQVNGVDVPLAIVDTGASHTLLSTQTAKAAGVQVGTSSRTAAGSLSFSATPGLVRELRIGNVILKNVPVNVGNPPPLVMTEAKVAIGVDIMHHLQFVLDYPANKVRVEPLSNGPNGSSTEKPAAAWDIPLWTFPEHCLSQAKLPDGSYARTLIDSGNFAQTLIWPTWAKQHLPNHPGPLGSMVLYSFSNPQRWIKGLSLGGRELPEWPGMDMPPVTLPGIDLLDLLMGNDLLAQYRVTIDMQNRRLRLESPGGEFKPPVAQEPFGMWGARGK